MLTFSDTIAPPRGGQTYYINVDQGRRPFGQIWWFEGHTSTVHAKTLRGERHQVFEGGNLARRIERAKEWMRKQAGTVLHSNPADGR